VATKKGTGVIPCLFPSPLKPKNINGIKTTTGGTMSKEKKSATERTIGEVINELSGKPMPLTFTINQEKFELFIHPASQEVLNTYSAMVDVKDPQAEKNRQADRYLICECVKDAKGQKVWNNPEDIKVEPFLYNQINFAVSQRIFGINLSEFAIKNL
jgi:hypothetical protein